LSLAEPNASNPSNPRPLPAANNSFVASQRVANASLTAGFSTVEGGGDDGHTLTLTNVQASTTANVQRFSKT
jgi:hypothetical protein